MKSMKFSSLVLVLTAATALSGSAMLPAQAEPAVTADDGGGTPPTKGVAIPENPAERGWRQTQEEFDALPDAQPSREKRKSDGMMKKMAADPVADEDWTPEKSELPDRDAVREGAKERKARKLAAQDAGKTVADKEIARQTRQAVTADKTLSAAARNVKIVSRGGKVTLKGRVASEAERSGIVKKAAAIVGAENVVDKMTVKTSKSK